MRITLIGGIMRHLIVIFLLVCVTCLGAVVRLVPQNYSTIQGAIVASSDGDQVLVSNGNYNENINFLGKAITVSSLYITDHDPAHISGTIINGTGTGSVVTCTSGEDSTSVLCGLTIRNGNYSLGGGISVRDSSPKLMNLIVHSNTGTQGAGVFVSNSHSRLINLTVCNNNGIGIKVAGNSVAEINSSIVYYNTSGISFNSSSSVSYSNLQNAVEGDSNISTEPMFVNHALYNYALAPGSPCINTGSPFLAAEGDGSRSDMGAIYHANSLPYVYMDFSASQTEMFSSSPFSVSFSPVIINFNCNISSYHWDFGNGTTSNQQLPTQTFQPGGYYTITLTLQDNFAVTHVLTKENYITAYNQLEGSTLSGTLTEDGSPYYCEGTMYINEGTTLTISPGVEIYLNNTENNVAGLGVSGSIYAVGTADNPIKISSITPERDAGALILNGGATLGHCIIQDLYSIQVGNMQSVIIDNCSISGSQSIAVYIQDGSATITNCTITNSGASAIAILHGSAEITGCQISQSVGNSIYCIDNDLTTTSSINVNNCTMANGSITYPNIYVGINNSALIHHNQISGGAAGISLASNSDSVIYNNTIQNNENSGIWMGALEFARIFNNIIRNNQWGIYLDSSGDSPVHIQGNLIYNNNEDGICLVNASPLISNNTIANNCLTATVNSAGIWWRESSSPLVINNIIYGNLADINANQIVAGNTPVLSYNLLENALNPAVVDSGNNIIGNPLFVSASDYRISSSSPAIDSGNPNPVYYNLLEFDIIGNIRVLDGDGNGTGTIDRGCYEFDQNSAIEDDVLVPSALKLNTYPNPMTSFLQINCKSQDKHNPYVLSIYNLKGQLVRTLEALIQDGETNCMWDGKDSKGHPMASGIYFLQAKNKQHNVVKKITLLR
jgi:parallel beta-helix repeat protein